MSYAADYRPPPPRRINTRRNSIIIVVCGVLAFVALMVVAAFDLPDRFHTEVDRRIDCMSDGSTEPC